MHAIYRKVIKFIDASSWNVYLDHVFVDGLVVRKSCYRLIGACIFLMLLLYILQRSNICVLLKQCARSYISASVAA